MTKKQAMELDYPIITQHNEVVAQGQNMYDYIDEFLASSCNDNKFLDFLEGCLDYDALKNKFDFAGYECYKNFEEFKDDYKHYDLNG